MGHGESFKSTEKGEKNVEQATEVSSAWSVQDRSILEKAHSRVPEQCPDEYTNQGKPAKAALLDSDPRISFKQENVQKGLSDAEKSQLQKETGWSNEIIDSISSLQEANIYKQAGLVEAEIGGKPCLIRTDIDWNQKDQFGRTNTERASQGLAPIDSNGQPLELHHIGQHNDSPLAELTVQEHRGKGNDTILHVKSKESEIDRPSFGVERAEHWKVRANTEGVNRNE